MWWKLIFACILGCSSSLTTSFDLRGVISGNRMAGVPLGVSLGNGELDVEGICSESGMACLNCTHAITCVSLPYGWLKVPLQECTEGFTCNAHEQTCSENPVPECGIVSQKYTHTCEQVGIFPDAFDCRKFHLCSPPEDLPDGRPADHRIGLCPRHYAYNPLTAQCSIRLKHGQCDFKPVPDCETLGQADALPDSPNHYYVCLVKEGYLYPQVFICPHGWYFWDGFCRPEPREQNPRPMDGKNEEVKDTNRSESQSVEVTKEDGKFSETKYNDKRRGFKETNTNFNNKNDRRGVTSSDFKPKATTSRIESFFSTEKPTTYAADTFLADKFDLTNYESIDDAAPSNDGFTNSFESADEFW